MALTHGGRLGLCDRHTLRDVVSIEICYKNLLSSSFLTLAKMSAVYFQAECMAFRWQTKGYDFPAGEKNRVESSLT